MQLEVGFDKLMLYFSLNLDQGKFLSALNPFYEQTQLCF